MRVPKMGDDEVDLGIALGQRNEQRGLARRVVAGMKDDRPLVFGAQLYERRHQLHVVREEVLPERMQLKPAKPVFVVPAAHLVDGALPAIRIDSRVTDHALRVSLTRLVDRAVRDEILGVDELRTLPRWREQTG